MRSLPCRLWTIPLGLVLAGSTLAPGGLAHGDVGAPMSSARAAADPSDSAATLPATAADSAGAASVVSTPALATPAYPLEQARALLRDGDYDRSIEVLKAALERASGDRERLRETYLLLIKTYVFLGNDLKFKPQGREASNLNYQEARRLITECLATRELRHTVPEPASQYPPEMVTFFAETRRDVFGAFRVRGTVPATALVLLDGDTLRALPGETLAGDVDITTGSHVVVVLAQGFKATTDRITIAPDVTLERTYRLSKRKGGLWYTTRTVGAAGIVGGLIAAIGGKSSTSAATASPLPGAPGPPSSP